MPMEEHLTSEDWAIMAAAERCPVWRILKSFNLREMEKLLAALRMVFQETVEGNPDRHTVSSLEDFRDWRRRWGQDDDNDQLALQCQWDNLLRHLMGITAAMEVWEPMAAADPGANATTTGDNPMTSEVEEQEMGPNSQHTNGDTSITSTTMHRSEPHDGEHSGGMTSPDQCAGEHAHPAGGTEPEGVSRRTARPLKGRDSTPITLHTEGFLRAIIRSISHHTWRGSLAAMLV